MKKFFWLPVLAICLAIVAGYNSDAGRTPDFDRDVYTTATNAHFRIKGARGHKSTIVETVNPWQGAKDVTTRLFIARDGEAVPADFDGQTIQGDAKRIIAMSSTHVAMLEALGAADRIVGVSGLDFLSSPTIKARRDSIADIGYDASVDYEKILSLQPDLVLLYGVNGASPMEPKLKEIGVPFMYVGDYLEEWPMDKTQWIVPVGEALGLRDLAINKFREISRRYETLKAQVKGTVRERPAVMLNMPYGDSWFMPSNGGSYISYLIADAGGDYIYKKDTGNVSRPIDLEEAYMLASKADFWLNTGAVTTLDEFKRDLPRFAALPVVQKGMLFNNNALLNAGGGNDFWETGTVEPDRILADLVRIFHPDLAARIKDFPAPKYYRQLK